MSMNLGLNPEHAPLLARVSAMIRDEIMPLEEEYHGEINKGDRWAYTERQAEILEGLKAKAKAAGLWNFWLTDSEKGFGLTTVDYAYFAEEMGRTPLGAEVFNCSAPDTGNMEVFERYGTDDRTGCGQLGCDEHCDVLCAGRGRLCAQRRKMVGQRGG